MGMSCEGRELVSEWSSGLKQYLLEGALDGWCSSQRFPQLEGLANEVIDDVLQDGRVVGLSAAQMLDQVRQRFARVREALD